jgi:hypothetical protein
MPRPRIPPIPHEPPQPGELAKQCCRCNLVWPLRLMEATASRCRNCDRDMRRQKRTRQNSRQAHLRTKYGITPEEFEARLVEQGGRCPCCKILLTRTEGPGPCGTDAAVDHDHSAERSVRGILCVLCNSGLGWFLDSPQALLNAAKYLLRTQSSSGEAARLAACEKRERERVEREASNARFREDLSRQPVPELGSKCSCGRVVPRLRYCKECKIYLCRWCQRDGHEHWRSVL